MSGGCRHGRPATNWRRPVLVVHELFNNDLYLLCPAFHRPIASCLNPRPSASLKKISIATKAVEQCPAAEVRFHAAGCHAVSKGAHKALHSDASMAYTLKCLDSSPIIPSKLALILSSCNTLTDPRYFPQCQASTYLGRLAFASYSCKVHLRSREWP